MSASRLVWKDVYWRTSVTCLVVVEWSCAMQSCGPLATPTPELSGRPSGMEEGARERGRVEGEGAREWRGSKGALSLLSLSPSFIPYPLFKAPIQIN